MLVDVDSLQRFDVSDVFGNNMNIILLWKKIGNCYLEEVKKQRLKLKHMYFAENLDLLIPSSWSTFLLIPWIIIILFFVYNDY